MSLLHFDAIIFDLDGVVTKTAHVHNTAWTETFNDFLKTFSEKHSQDYQPFSYEEDYLPYVDGKPRYKGVASFLASRGIELPEGDPADPPSQDSICGLGNIKNDRFNKLIQEGIVEIYPSTIELIKRLIKTLFLILLLTKTPVLAAQKMITIYGRVSEEISGKPIDNVRVIVEPKKSATTIPVTVLDTAPDISLTPGTTASLMLGTTTILSVALSVPEKPLEVLTDLNGKYEVKIPTGAYIITFKKNEY